jgi:hypothetical protein
VKQIIDGKTYNVATATQIGGEHEISNNISVTDFKFYRATLYRTRRGAYFLAGRGGPMSLFAHRRDDGSTSGSEGIVPLDADEALALAERHLDPDEVAEHFADQIEEA